mgnify:CR=1 FL=1
MFQSIYSFIIQHTNIIFYLAPCLTCLIAYTHKTIKNYKKDLLKRSDKFYTPTDRVVDIVSRLLISLIPFLNIVAALFDAGPHIISWIYLKLEFILSQPLVSEKKLNIPPVDEKSHTPIKCG